MGIRLLLVVVLLAASAVLSASPLILREAPAPSVSVEEVVPAVDAQDVDPSIAVAFEASDIEEQIPPDAFALTGIAGVQGAFTKLPETVTVQMSRLDAIPVEQPGSLLGLSVALFLIGIAGQAMIESWRLQAEAARSRSRY
jgi:hypothetical protein